MNDRTTTGGPGDEPEIDDDVWSLAEVPVTITDCAQAFVGLPLFLDGALADQQQRSMQEHLDQCPPCLGALQFQAGLRSIVQRGCHDDPPLGLRDRVFERIFSDNPGKGLGFDSGRGL